MKDQFGGVSTRRTQFSSRGRRTSNIRPSRNTTRRPSNIRNTTRRIHPLTIHRRRNSQRSRGNLERLAEQARHQPNRDRGESIRSIFGKPINAILWITSKIFPPGAPASQLMFTNLSVSAIMARVTYFYRFLEVDIPTYTFLTLFLNFILNNLISIIRSRSSFREIRRLFFLFIYKIRGKEREFRNEEIEIESLLERNLINEAEYIRRMNSLRDRANLWINRIRRLEVLSPDELFELQTPQDFEMWVERTRPFNRSDSSSSDNEEPLDNDEESLDAILQRYNTTNINQAIQSAMRNNDRNSIRILMNNR